MLTSNSLHDGNTPSGLAGVLTAAVLLDCSQLALTSELTSDVAPRNDRWIVVENGCTFSSCTVMLRPSSEACDATETHGPGV